MVLHPDLQEYVKALDGMEIIQHPLVYQVPFFGSEMEIDFANRMYAQKLEAIEQAIKEHDVHRCITMHEKPWRLLAFLKHRELIEQHTREYWEIVNSVWIGSENIWQHVERWIEIFQEPNNHLFMDESEQAYLDRAFAGGRKLTVYRGGSNDGLSYTVSRAKAEWFAGRYLWETALRTVRTIEVTRDQVVAYTNQREEREIILKEIPDAG